MNDPQLIDKWEASDLLGTTPDGLRRLTRDGLLPVYKIGQRKQSRLRYSRADVTALIEAGRVAEGHPTKRGGRWTSPVVARILARSEPVHEAVFIDPPEES